MCIIMDEVVNINKLQVDTQILFQVYLFPIFNRHRLLALCKSHQEHLSNCQPSEYFIEVPE